MLAIGLASLLGAGAAAAGALVEFPNLPEHAPRLLGYLARPDSGLSADSTKAVPTAADRSRRLLYCTVALA